MYSSSLIEIFKKFTPKEMKEFEEFVASPYYNKNKNVITLFDLLKTEYPDFSKGELTKEKAFKVIYKGNKYNDGTIRLLMFYLQEVVEKYLAVKNFESHPFAAKIHLLNELNIRELHKMFEKSYKSIKKEVVHTKELSYDYYLGKFFIEYEHLSHLSLINFDRDEKYVGKINVTKTFDNLTYSYLIRIFKYYLYYINIRTKFNVNQEFKQFEELIIRHNTDEYKDVPTVNMYYYCLMMLRKPEDESYYFKGKALLFENEDRFAPDDRVEFYIGLENYCKRRYKIGKEEYKDEIFEIYQAEIRKKAYLINGMMPDLFYKSVVDLALQLKKYDWVYDFMQEYTNELPEKFRENTYFHCMGVYEFAKDNFEKALELISKVKFDEIYQKLDIKCLLNGIYYELDLSSSLESGIDSFRHFLKNDKIIPPERKVPFSIFNKNIMKLYKLRNNPDLEELELFHDNIESGIYYNKEWILSKANDLIDKYNSKSKDEPPVYQNSLKKM